MENDVYGSDMMEELELLLQDLLDRDGEELGSTALEIFALFKKKGYTNDRS